MTAEVSPSSISSNHQSSIICRNKMSSKPLVTRYDIRGVPFAIQFLAADDFDVATLRQICKDLRLNQVGKKNVLLKYIESYLESDRSFHAAEPIIVNLARRVKKWFTFK